MQIREIDPRKVGDVRSFVRFPFRLYENCDQWTPPILSSARLALDRRRHPFYHHSDAGFFIAEREGDAIGRIAVLENRRYNDYNKAKVAFFYYFDTVEDVEVARGLIDAAGAWARARGLQMLMGPKGMLRADAYGVLVEGFEYPAGMGIPYNYPYYAQLLEQIGMEKEIDYVSGYMVAENQLPERLFRTVERLKERGGFWVKSFTTKRELRGWIPKIQRVNNEAFTQVWGYYPIDDEEVRMIGKQMLLAADPRLLKVVMKDESIAGFAFRLSRHRRDPARHRRATLALWLGPVADRTQAHQAADGQWRGAAAAVSGARGQRHDVRGAARYHPGAQGRVL